MQVVKYIFTLHVLKHGQLQVKLVIVKPARRPKHLGAEAETTKRLIEHKALLKARGFLPTLRTIHTLPGTLTRLGLGVQWRQQSSFGRM